MKLIYGLSERPIFSPNLMILRDISASQNKLQLLEESLFPSSGSNMLQALMRTEAGLVGAGLKLLRLEDKGRNLSPKNKTWPVLLCAQAIIVSLELSFSFCYCEIPSAIHSSWVFHSCWWAVSLWCFSWSLLCSLLVLTQAPYAQLSAQHFYHFRAPISSWYKKMLSIHMVQRCFLNKS